MFLRELHVRQFRGYDSLDLSLKAGPNLFVGPNGAGKSNLLEAVSVLATGNSHRDAESRQFFPWDKDALFLRGEFEGEESVVVEARQEKGRPRQVKVNNAFQKRLRDWVGRVPVVTFSPEDLNLIKGDPSTRRRALDDILIQTSPGYADLLQRYNKTLEERNAALRAIQEGKASPSSLEPWDISLLREGAALTLARRDFVRAFAPKLAERHGGLASDKETAGLAYKPSCTLPAIPERSSPSPSRKDPGEGKGESAEVAAANRRRLQDLRDGEFATGNTLIGPHRDDVEFSLNSRSAKAFGSQGQQRTLAIAFKFTEKDFLEERLSREPLCLLDDMLSELDGGRRRNLQEILSGGAQCLITLTSLQDWDRSAALPSEANVFDLNEGRIARSAAV